MGLLASVRVLSLAVLMEKSSSSPVVTLQDVPGDDGKKNDLVFCGSEAQQHVVFFPGDVQVLIIISAILVTICCEP